MTLTARASCTLGLAAVALALLAPADAAAIPAFARKYRQSCTTCHAPFPRLKPYGEEFAGRGFRMEEGAEPGRGDPRQVGAAAEALRKAVREAGFPFSGAEKTKPA